MTACQHLTIVGVDNRCDQWPDRPKFVSDQHRANVCVAKRGKGCVWLSTTKPILITNPVQSDEAMPSPQAGIDTQLYWAEHRASAQRPRFKSTFDAMSLRAVSVMFGHKSSEDWPRRWITFGWLNAERTNYAYRIRHDDLLTFVTVPEAWPTYAVADILDENLREAARAARLVVGAPLTARYRPSTLGLELQTRHDWTPALEAQLLRLRAQNVSWKKISRDMDIPMTTLQRRHRKITS